MGSTTGSDKGGGHVQSRHTVPKAIAALAVPAAGYLVVYAHESGFLSAFNIPTAVASLNLVTVIQVSLALLGALAILFWFGNLVSMLWPEGRRLTRNHVRILLEAGVAGIGVALVFLWPQQRQLGVMLVCMGGLFAFMDFVWPLVTQRGRRPYKEKLEAVDRIDEKTKTLFDRMAASYGAGVLVLLLLVWALCGFAYYLGLYTAQHKAEYLVVKMADGREAVVLREYHDRMICSAFDRKLLRLEGGFFVLDVTSESVLWLNREKVGPLHPQEPGTTERSAGGNARVYHRILQVRGAPLLGRLSS